MSGSGVGVSGPLVCIFRSLARVLDSNRTSLTPSKREKMVNLAFEIFFCVVFPAIIMILQYVVQDRRYYIYSIVGCQPSFHNSWVAVAVGWIWAPIVLIIAVFYCSKYN
jgi:pheromone a factor receptor